MFNVFPETVVVTLVPLASVPVPFTGVVHEPQLPEPSLTNKFPLT
jgi:hypothetical protein